MDSIMYKKTAKKWCEALPLGNGFNGVMVYGSHKKERLCFNDGVLWSGYPKDYNSPESLENLEKVRSLIFEGKNSEADALCEDKLKGFYTETFLPPGDIIIDLGKSGKKIKERSLDLSTGIHTVKSNGMTSEIFSSYPDRITLYRIKSDKKFSAAIYAQSKLRHEVVAEPESLTLYGNAPDYVAPHYLPEERSPVKYNENKGMAFCLCVRIYTDGVIESENNCVRISDASEITLYFASATGFESFDKMPVTDTDFVIKKCKAHLDNVEKSYDKLKKRHIEDFSRLYNRQRVSLGRDINIPADRLRRLAKRGKCIGELCGLLYNYGKYLTISGSRRGGQPLTLQGIWNASLRPPWSCNYTVNINTQMNYWGASRAGLSECIEPLIRMVYEALETGAKTAEINYGCRGFAINHNTDLWRKTPPVAGEASYMFEPLCGVWLSNEIYSHYKNGFLNEYGFKIERIVTEAARFLNDYLVFYNGNFVICPSASPENEFISGGKRCRLDYASAFDMGLVRQAFNNALEISRDSTLKKEIDEKYPLLYPFKKGDDGICEWHEPYLTPEKGHRHFSPLYAFYPAKLIGYYSDIEQSLWIKKLFEYRLKHSGHHIGWSAAWAICLAARLRKADTVQKVIEGMLKYALFKNLFCSHPPSFFQIDGNFGFVAGINETLITEENGIIELLPALPKKISESGCVKNMVVHGAEISFKWNNSSVTEISSNKPVSVYYKNIADNAAVDKTISFVYEI